MVPPDTIEAIGFYWAKVIYHYDPEPLIHWEVLHWEDGHWWGTAIKKPLLERDVLELKEKLIAPDDGEW